MAITWGNYEYSGGLGIRVGIDIDWSNVVYTSDTAVATVRYYTQNKYGWNDSQGLNLSGAIGGSASFHNGAGDGDVVLRATRTHTVTYGASSYGTSPGTRTFGATLTGAFNGITPSHSRTIAIPPRPYAAPLAPENVNATRLSDTSMKLTWTNTSTAGRPWDASYVEVLDTPGGNYRRIAIPSGVASSLSWGGSVANRLYRWRIYASNSVGTSGNTYSNYIYTSPAVATNVTRTTSGANQVITWTNNVGYDAYATEVWHAADGVWDAAPLTTLGAGVTTYTHSSPNATQAHKYRLRVRTDNLPVTGTHIYSSYSAATTESSPSSSPPNAPTSVSPSGIVINPALARSFSWTHNPSDGSAQSAYELRWRYSGTSTWTTTGKVASGTSSRSMAGGTFANDETVEWQVRTWGTSTTAGPYSTVATFSTASDPTALRSNRRALVLNTDTGETETVHVDVFRVDGTKWRLGPFIGDGDTVATTMPLISVRRDAAQSCTGSASTTISFDTADEWLNMPDTWSSRSAIAVPKTGLYRITGGFALNSSTTDAMFMGTFVLAGGGVTFSRGGGSPYAPVTQRGTHLERLTAGQYVSLALFHTAATCSTYGGTQYRTELQLEWIAP